VLGHGPGFRNQVTAFGVEQGLGALSSGLVLDPEDRIRRLVELGLKAKK
jgi:hypothetical protein